MDRRKLRILLIEDDKLTAEILSVILTKAGYRLKIVSFGEDALNIINEGFKVIILDLLLPDMHGVDFLRTARSREINIPILILSALSDIESKLSCLRTGADDFLSKPFDHRELILRLEILTKRNNNEYNGSNLFVAGLQFNDAQQCVYYKNKREDFTRKEYLIIRALVEKQGTPISKSELIKIIYDGTDKRPNSKIIDVFIYKIRRKLELLTDNKKMIKTVWGVGIMFSDGN